jgi:hypothetical protein
MTFIPELNPFRLVSADNHGCGESSYDENHPPNIDGVVEVIESFMAHWLIWSLTASCSSAVASEG